MKKVIIAAVVIGVVVIGCIAALFPFLSTLFCEHDFRYDSTLVKATCTEAGVRTDKCSKCGKTVQVTTPKNDHNWIAATCESPRRCTFCGQTDGSALGHKWEDATCTKPKTCSKCGATSGSALGHSFTDATCTSPGTCARCGAKGSEATGHSWVAATCTKPKTCSKCGATSGSALGHSFTGATCTTPGKCARCGATGEKAPHSWVDATCTSPKKCSVCGATSGSALGHNYVNKKCTRCGKTDPAQSSNSSGSDGSSQSSKNNAPMTHGYYYGTLTKDVDKTVYDVIYNCVKNTQAQLDKADFFGKPGITFDYIYRIFEYVLDDHPELFHLSAEVNGKIYPDKSVAVLYFTYSMSQSQYKSALEWVDSTVSSVLSRANKASDDAEKAIILYDYIKNTLSYDLSRAGKTSFDLYGALTTGKAVCEGYSELFSFLLSKVGIEFAIVRGTASGVNHQWTMAKLNGRWYYFDVTFDDPTGEVISDALYYNYFAVDEKTITKDHALSQALVSIVPEATSLNDNYFIKNGIYLDSLSENAMKTAAKNSYALCGHIAVMCSPEVLKAILESDDYYFKLVEYAYGTKSADTTYTYNETSGVIEIIVKNS